MVRTSVLPANAAQNAYDQCSSVVELHRVLTLPEKAAEKALLSPALSSKGGEGENHVTGIVHWTSG
jgi:hypothetical protein